MDKSVRIIYRIMLAKPTPFYVETIIELRQAWCAREIKLMVMGIYNG